MSICAFRGMLYTSSRDAWDCLAEAQSSSCYEWPHFASIGLLCSVRRCYLMFITVKKMLLQIVAGEREVQDAASRITNRE